MRNIFNRLNQSTSASTQVGVYGSSRASTFIKDCMAGTDSIDVVTVGDSNAGNGNSGYQCGLAYSFTNFGMSLYATPIAPTADATGANNRSGGMFLPHNKFNWTGASTAGSTGTVLALTSAATSLLAPAVELEATLGYNKTILPKPNAFEWNAAYVNTAVTYTSPANGTAVKIFPSSPMANGTGAAGVSLQYRLVYGTFSTSGGSFKLAAMKGVNTLITGTQSPAGTISTAGGTGVATATYTFVSPATSSVPQELFCSYDGYAGATSSVVGPFAAIYHSVIELKKGYCVSNMIYDGGKTTAQLADRVEGMGILAGNLLPTYLKELKERQIAAGGTGRVIVWCNSGVNGPDTGAVYTLNVERIKQAFKSAWLANGFDLGNLAFIFSVTHPIDPSAQETTLISTRTAANAWASTNAGDGTGTCVVDISALWTYSKLLNNRLYDITSNAPYYAHLRGNANTNITTTNGLYTAGNYYDLLGLNNGYEIVCNSILNELIK